MSNIFAYTPPTGYGYPPYISINRRDDGDIQVIVRSPPSKIGANIFREGVTASMTIPAAEWPGFVPRQLSE